MAKNVAKNGYQMIVADKMNTKSAPEGTQIASNNLEVISEANILILSPAGPDTLEITREILTAPNSSVKIVVDTSTIGIPMHKKLQNYF